MASIEWILHFPTSHIYHLDAFHSDHKPILLCSDSELKQFYKDGRPFHFEALWLKDRSCEDVVRDSWEVNQVEGSTWCLNKKIYSCKDNLRTWNHNTFGHVRNSLQRKQTKLKTMEESGRYRHNLNRIQALREEIQKLKSKEECMWEQRSRSAWLKRGG